MDTERTSKHQMDDFGSQKKQKEEHLSDTENLPSETSINLQMVGCLVLKESLGFVGQENNSKRFFQGTQRNHLKIDGH